MSLPIRFRRSRHRDSLEGTTIDTSASGVLFQHAGESRLALNSRIDMQLFMPSAAGGQPVTRVNCSGRVVRILRGTAPTDTTYVAATIDKYRLERIPSS